MALLNMLNILRGLAGGQGLTPEVDEDFQANFDAFRNGVTPTPEQEEVANTVLTFDDRLKALEAWREDIDLGDDDEQPKAAATQDADLPAPQAGGPAPPAPPEAQAAGDAGAQTDQVQALEPGLAPGLQVETGAADAGAQQPATAAADAPVADPAADDTGGV
ncbi:MAG TPA: hypothetical protein VHX64_06990 [Caulobacteraceae bacterium]|jgi:hypothetical protein|nr:hypothetical protein [Caulobacteraceae bacterium]